MADCYLIAAPAIVDSAATKRALIERCGFKEVFDFAKQLDAVVVSVGSTKRIRRPTFTESSPRPNWMRCAARRHRRHPVQFLRHRWPAGRTSAQRTIDVDSDFDAARRAEPRARLGGLDKVDAIVGAFKLLRPTVVITDEITAEALLARADGESAAALARPAP